MPLGPRDMPYSENCLRTFSKKIYYQNALYF